MDFVWGAIQFAQLGITSNWFGLSCPSHCGAPVWGTIIGIFLSGFLLGAGSVVVGILALFGSLSSPLWHIHLRQLLVLLGTCMSTPGSEASEDSVAELTLQIAGLTVTVRGPLDRAAYFVEYVSRYPRASSGGSLRPPQEATTGLGGNDSHSVSAVSAASSAGFETRASIAASFPPCPDRYLRLAACHLSGGPRLSAELRASRAWVAGCWAKAVKDGRVSSPNRTATIDLQNRYWAVVRSSGCSTPRIFTTSRAYHEAVGPFAVPRFPIRDGGKDLPGRRGA